MQKPKAALQLYDSIGDFIEYWGFKRIHGRIWGVVFLSHESPTTPEIVGTLGVSKALVSIAINELLEYKLIKLGPKKEYGAQSYLAEENIAKVVRDVLRDRELQLIRKTGEHLAKLSSYSAPELKQAEIDPIRLKQLRSLTEASRDLLEASIAKDMRTMDDWFKLLKAAIRLERQTR